MSPGGGASRNTACGARSPTRLCMIQRPKQGNKFPQVSAKRFLHAVSLAVHVREHPWSRSSASYTRPKITTALQRKICTHSHTSNPLCRAASSDVVSFIPGMRPNSFTHSTIRPFPVSCRFGWQAVRMFFAMAGTLRMEGAAIRARSTLILSLLSRHALSQFGEELCPK